MSNTSPKPRFSPPPTLLYALTLLLETPVVLVRLLLVYFASSLLLWLSGHSTGHASDLAYLALLPTVLSLLTYFGSPGAGLWWRLVVGGREPSRRELLAYQDAFALLADSTPRHGPPLVRPGSLFVVDDPQPNAAVRAKALMLSSGLLESPYLAAALAHELGHLAGRDGCTLAALGYLRLPVPAIVRPDRLSSANAADPRVIVVPPSTRTLTLFGLLLLILKSVLRFARGGHARRLTAPVWARHWREREYAADRFAAGLGQGEELAALLELYVLVQDHPVPFAPLDPNLVHPPTELRIDRLRNPAPETPHGA